MKLTKSRVFTNTQDSTLDGAVFYPPRKFARPTFRRRHSTLY